MNSDYKYHELIQKFVFNVSANFRIHSIWQYGTINAPGLSDIDLIIVVPDDILIGEIIDLDRFTGQNYTGSKFYDISSFKIFPESIFQNINLLGKIRVKNLHGGIMPPKLYDAVSASIIILDIFDWLLERICKNWWNINTILPPQQMWGDLYSLRHSLVRLSALVPSPSLDDLIAAIETERNLYVDNRNDWHSKFYDLSTRAIAQSARSFYELTNKLIAENQALICTADFEKIGKFWFNDYFNYNVCSNQFFNTRIIKNLVIWTLCYFNGWMSSNYKVLPVIITKHLINHENCTKIRFDENLYSVFRERTNLLDHLMSFYIDKRIQRNRMYRLGHLSYFNIN